MAAWRHGGMAAWRRRAVRGHARGGHAHNARCAVRGARCAYRLAANLDVGRRDEPIGEELRGLGDGDVRETPRVKVGVGAAEHERGACEPCHERGDRVGGARGGEWWPSQRANAGAEPHGPNDEGRAHARAFGSARCVCCTPAFSPDAR
eukprot:7265857-Prymnesium_polylepis.1